MRIPDDQWDDNEFPLAYLITIRTYGTWLHGDQRGWVDRHGKNIYGTPREEFNPGLLRQVKEELKRPPFILNQSQRIAVDQEIKDVCQRRRYDLRALNVRTNHLHSVVSAQTKPERIINAFKSNATRALREQNLVTRDVYGLAEKADDICGSLEAWRSRLITLSISREII
jgi:hypothetical protein